MAHVFISYSRSDSSQALELLDVLRSNGIDTWIDRTGIEGSSSWGSEIAKAIEDCGTLLLLLSPRSVSSRHVEREVMLAFEREKRILPVILEPVEIPISIRYQLAGLQHLALNDLAGILRVLTLPDTRAAQTQRILSAAPRNRRTFQLIAGPSLLAILVLGFFLVRGSRPVSAGPESLSLAVLSLEDGSPDRSNRYIASGISAEIAGSLSKLPGLRVVPQNTINDYNEIGASPLSVASELGVNYVTSGRLERSGDELHATLQLIEATSGKVVWSNQYAGSMADLFALQEKMVSGLVDAMRVKLPSTGSRLTPRYTTNPEAYELYLKAWELRWHYGPRDFQNAISLLQQTLQLDSNFHQCYGALAQIYSDYYHLFDQSDSISSAAYQYALKAIEVSPREPVGYAALARFSAVKGDLSAATIAARKAIALDTNNASSYSNYGYVCQVDGDVRTAVQAYSHALRLDSTDRWTYVNLAFAAGALYEHDTARFNRLWNDTLMPRGRARWAVYAQRHPDDNHARLISSLFGNHGDFWDMLDKFKLVASDPSVSAYTLLTLSEVYAFLHAPEAIPLLRRSVREGLKLDIQHEPLLLSLRNNSAFAAIVREQKALR
ncbi:MAG: TIR domain-containing protein [Bacteroidota bacterium]|nr:TIR domain-containing protein [Bacteroidota bacterium]MDP4233266.1 TIR domain-containing protein [Bacteroidota bacterium]MDP4242114.1 TIR domain-containing protein [Bacteroidota bacterium]MDP4288607.1 TIR domain-containing protein [Bacteroidota bacterium]